MDRARRRGVALAAVVALAAGPIPTVLGEGRTAPAKPRTLTLSPRPRPALVDCRSPVVPHEAVLVPETAWTVGDTSLVARRRGGKWEVEVSRPGDPSPDRKSFSKLPALLEVTAFGGPYGISLRASGDGERLVASSAQGASVPVGKVVAWVVDSDRDGALGSAGDGLVAPGARTVSPLAGEAWHRDAAVRFEKTGSGVRDEWSVADLPMPYPDHGDHGAAWRLLNWRRQQVGVRPADYDPAFEDGIRKHAAYCRRNGFQGHEEEKARAGWTAEGAEAGMNSVLSYPGGRTSFVAEVETQLATLYHRHGVLAGGLARSALVMSEGMFGMRIARDRETPLASAPVVFPPHGMEEAPRRFHPPGEIPAPWEGPISAGNRGPAIGVALPRLRWCEALPAPPALVVEPPKGSPLDGDFHYPGRNPSKVQKDNLECVAITPTAPLAATTTYRARIRVPLPAVSGGPPEAFEYEWEFTTGP